MSTSRTSHTYQQHNTTRCAGLRTTNDNIDVRTMLCIPCTRQMVPHRLRTMRTYHNIASPLPKCTMTPSPRHTECSATACQHMTLVLGPESWLLYCPRNGLTHRRWLQYTALQSVPLDSATAAACFASVGRGNGPGVFVTLHANQMPTKMAPIVATPPPSASSEPNACVPEFVASFIIPPISTARC